MNFAVGNCFNEGQSHVDPGMPEVQALFDLLILLNEKVNPTRKVVSFSIPANIQLPGWPIHVPAGKFEVRIPERTLCITDLD